jgi:hypothetical protein
MLAEIDDEPVRRGADGLDEGVSDGDGHPIGTRSRLRVAHHYGDPPRLSLPAHDGGVDGRRRGRVATAVSWWPSRSTAVGVPGLAPSIGPAVASTVAGSRRGALDVTCDNLATNIFG